MTRTRKDQTVRQSKDAGNESGIGTATTEKRFAFSLLEKLLEYVDKAAYNMKNTKPSSRFSRRHSFSMSSEDVKFFGKVAFSHFVLQAQFNSDAQRLVYVLYKWLHLSVAMVCVNRLRSVTFRLYTNLFLSV